MYQEKIQEREKITKIIKFNWYITTILFFLIFHKVCISQAVFQKTFGGTASEIPWSINKTSDGGFAVAGQTYSYGAGSLDFYIVKFDSSGNYQWRKTTGGDNNDAAYSIIQTTDGGYAVAGVTSSFGARSNDIYFVMFNNNGNLIWSKNVGHIYYDEKANSIIQTPGGSFVIAGYTASFGAGANDLYVVKLDSIGNPLWSVAVGGAGSEEANSLIAASDGGFLTAGHTTSFGPGGINFYFVKFDSTGNFQWNKTVGGPNNEVANSLVRTTDGGYAAAGYTLSFGSGAEDFYIVKLDSGGNLLWSRTVGGAGNDFANTIIQTSDGGFAAAGYTTSFGMLDNFYVVKLDGNGNLEWSKTIGGAGDDIAYSIMQSPDGSLIAVGRTNSFGAGGNDFYIVKIDSSGNTCGNAASPPSLSGTGGTSGTPSPNVIFQPPPVNSPPSSTSDGGNSTTVCTLVNITKISSGIPNSFDLLQNYPNPFNPKTVISFRLAVSSFTTLKIYDLLGREISTLISEELKPGTYEVDWDASNYPTGVYFYRITAGDFSEVKKMMLVK